MDWEKTSVWARVDFRAPLRNIVRGAPFIAEATHPLQAWKIHRSILTRFPNLPYYTDDSGLTLCETMCILRHVCSVHAPHLLKSADTCASRHDEALFYVWDCVLMLRAHQYGYLPQSTTVQRKLKTGKTGDLCLDDACYTEETMHTVRDTVHEVAETALSKSGPFVFGKQPMLVDVVLYDLLDAARLCGAVPSEDVQEFIDAFESIPLDCKISVDEKGVSTQRSHGKNPRRGMIGKSTLLRAAHARKQPWKRIRLRPCERSDRHESREGHPLRTRRIVGDLPWRFGTPASGRQERVAKGRLVVACCEPLIVEYFELFRVPVIHSAYACNKNERRRESKKAPRPHTLVTHETVPKNKKMLSSFITRPPADSASVRPRRPHPLPPPNHRRGPPSPQRTRITSGSTSATPCSVARIPTSDPSRRADSHRAHGRRNADRGGLRRGEPGPRKAL